MKEVNGEQEYQGISIVSCDSLVDECKVHVLADLKRLEGAIKCRLEWTNTGLLRAMLLFLETKLAEERQ